MSEIMTGYSSEITGDKSKVPPEKVPEHRIEIEAHRTDSLDIAIASQAKGEVNEDSTLFSEKEGIVAVLDGAGGQNGGAIASRLARDNFIDAIKAEREFVTQLPEKKRIELWENVLGSNSYITPDDRSTYAERFASDLAREESAFGITPLDVQNEAMIIFKGLKTLSKAIAEVGAKPGNEHLKDMATTITGIKEMTASDGRRYGIFFGVGDSEAYFKPKSGPSESVIASDTVWNHAIARDIFSPEKTPEYYTLKDGVMVPDLTNPMTRRFMLVAAGQLMGVGDPYPHISIRELQAGDRFLLASDGIIDNDPKGEAKQDLENTVSMSALNEKLISRSTRIAEEVTQGAKVKGKGWDDMTSIAGEVRTDIEEDLKEWQMAVEIELARAGLTGLEASMMRAQINDLKPEINRDVRLVIAETKAERKHEGLRKEIALGKKIAEYINGLSKKPN